MLTHPTLDQLRKLGLAGMARAFAELVASPRSAELDHAEWLALLLDREGADREDRRLKARLRYTRLRHQAAVEDVDYRTPRGLDRALFQKLALGFLQAKSPVVDRLLRPMDSVHEGAKRAVLGHFHQLLPRHQ